MAGLFVDANLMVLLVVGNVGRHLIAKHRRLQDFSARDYDILVRLLNRAGRMYVTPNTLTETSNLLAQHQDPERTYFFLMLRAMIQESEEIVVSSASASASGEFLRLGLTDASLLEIATRETPVLTVDTGLYLAALDRRESSAVNFTSLR